MHTPAYPFALRLVETNDGEALLGLIERNRPRLLDYFPVTAATICSLADSFRFVDEKIAQAEAKEQYTFMIEDNNGQLQGLVFLKDLDWRVPKGELAYFIDGGLQGKGITTWAVKAVTDYSFTTLGLTKLFIITSVDNIASRKMAEKAGFEVEGILRQNFRTAAGAMVDMVYYGILADPI